MNFTDKQKAWILLSSLVISAGGAVFLASYAGGAKLWFALVSGFITGASSVYHALSKSPLDAVGSSNPSNPSK